MRGLRPHHGSPGPNACRPSQKIPLMPQSLNLQPPSFLRSPVRSRFRSCLPPKIFLAFSIFFGSPNLRFEYLYCFEFLGLTAFESSFHRILFACPSINAIRLTTHLRYCFFCSSFSWNHIFECEFPPFLRDGVLTVIKIPGMTHNPASIILESAVWILACRMSKQSFSFSFSLSESNWVFLPPGSTFCLRLRYTFICMFPFAAGFIRKCIQLWEIADLKIANCNFQIVKLVNS